MPGTIRRALCALVVAIAAVEAAAQPSKTHGGLPFVSPDGSKIAFIRGVTMASADLYVINADGSGERRVGEAGFGPGRWLPDGRLIVSTSKFTDDTTVLMAIKPDGSSRELFARFAGRDAAVAPSGRDLTIGIGKFPNTRLAHLPLGGTEAHPLVTEPGMYFNTVYSPDGRQLAFARSGADRQLQVWVMNNDGSGMRPLTKFTAAEGSPQWPTWSPDGKWVAIQSGVYNREKPELNTAHIWLIEVATGKAVKLAAHDDRPYLDETPSFFPDGKRIAFQSDRTGRMEIWVMNVDGTGARQLTR